MEAKKSKRPQLRRPSRSARQIALQKMLLSAMATKATQEEQ
jgi:hypothetical protein